MSIQYHGPNVSDSAENEPPVFQRSADAQKQLILFKRFKDVIVSATANGLQGR